MILPERDFKDGELHVNRLYFLILAMLFTQHSNTDFEKAQVLFDFFDSDMGYNGNIILQKHKLQTNLILEHYLMIAID